MEVAEVLKAPSKAFRPCEASVFSDGAASRSDNPICYKSFMARSSTLPRIQGFHPWEAGGAPARATISRSNIITANESRCQRED